MNAPLKLLIIPLLLAACAKQTPGADPHDMSSAEHEAAASGHEAAAEAHAAQFDPNAAVVEERCKPPGRGIPYNQGCWSSVTNPTEAHLKMAADEQKKAADHRAASEALRAAEAQACAGIAPEDRDMSPFRHTEDIASVEALTGPTGPKGELATVGAVVTFRAVPGMTAEWLQRIVDCHLARGAAMGHDLAAMPGCPLIPAGAKATVSSTGTGFAVAVRSEDPAAAAEILARAQRLVSPAAPSGGAP